MVIAKLRLQVNDLLFELSDPLLQLILQELPVDTCISVGINQHSFIHLLQLDYLKTMLLY